MATLPDTLAMLSAMTTPAVLVLANASLLTNTSQRLSGSITRQRDAAKQLRDYQRQPPAVPEPGEQAHLTTQLALAAQQARLLQQAMTVLHLTLGVFVASICVIGFLEFSHSPGTWVIALLSGLGALLLFAGSVLLIKESRLALTAVADESTYLTRLT